MISLQRIFPLLSKVEALVHTPIMVPSSCRRGLSMYKEVIQENDGARHETLMQNTQQKISSTRFF